MTYFMLYFICERRSFFHGASSGCASLHGLFFLQKFRKSLRQCPTSCGCKKIRQKFAPAGKSDILYTRAEEEEFPQCIRRIRRRVRSFLCFRPPLPLPTAGVLCFAAGEIRHTVCINTKKRKEKKSYET